jgi:hypothetical protein
LCLPESMSAEEFRKEAALISGKRSKYGAKKVKCDGITFDSQGEYKHYLKLKERQNRGEISLLTVHATYPLFAAAKNSHGQMFVCKIAPDFEYVENGVLVTADFKGVVTSSWRLKAKIFKANYGREILVVKAS